MDKIIALVFSIILVLGLFAYAVLGQVAGIKDTSDRAAIEQNKVNQMIQDQNTVTGNTVKNYKNQESKTLEVNIEGPDEEEQEVKDVKDNAIYKMQKKYNANGELCRVDFTQVDLSKKTGD